MQRKLMLTLLVGLVTLIGLRPVYAHQQHDHFYVAADGVDTGNCRVPLRPCRTIGYALQQARTKGAEIRVAAGYYSLTEAEATAALGATVWVQGGYTPDDYFTTADPQQYPTYLLGVDLQLRAAFAAQGLIVLQDKKALLWKNDVIEETDATGAALAVAAAPATCTNGMAGAYPCQGIDLLAQVPLNSFPGAPTSASNLWGHTDLNSGREYALIGLRNGTAIVDITTPTAPRIVTLIPAAASLWRELRAYQTYDAVARRWRAYAYIVTEASGQGMQIVDLSDLPLSAKLVNTYLGVARAHTIHLDNTSYDTNITRNGAPGRAILQGSNLNSGAFRILNLTNPVTPTLQVEAPSGTQYVHDGTSLVITDTRTIDCYQGHNPCTLYVDYNENSVDLWDVTPGAPPYRISSTPYTGSRYTHSGWWTQDKRYLFIQDELDEYYLGHNTRVRTLDINNLRAPVVSGTWNGPTRAIDHNGYTKGVRYYMSNYQRGLTILNLTNPNALSQEAFFDSYPTANDAAFNGAWGTYPYFPSGNVAISDIESGLFLVREQRLGSAVVPPATLHLRLESRPKAKINFLFTGALGSFRLDDNGADDGDAFSAERFAIKPAGTYVVTPQAVVGWYPKAVRCQAAGGTEEIRAPGAVSLSVTAGAYSACTFVNERAASVRVLVYDDRNGSGRRNNNEAWLANWTIELREVTSGGVMTLPTNELGKVSFGTITPGAYVVCEVLTPGWRNTQPGLDPTDGKPCYHLTLAPAESKTIYFGNTTNPAVANSAIADEVLAQQSVISSQVLEEVEAEQLATQAWLITPETEPTNLLYLPIVQQ